MALDVIVPVPVIEDVMLDTGSLNLMVVVEVEGVVVDTTEPTPTQYETAISTTQELPTAGFQASN